MLADVDGSFWSPIFYPRDTEVDADLTLLRLNVGPNPVSAKLMFAAKAVWIYFTHRAEELCVLASFRIIHCFQDLGGIGYESSPMQSVWTSYLRAGVSLMCTRTGTRGPWLRDCAENGWLAAI